MKCKYKFRIFGKFKPSALEPVSVRGAIYKFEVNENNLATHISVTIQADDERYWPTVIPNPSPGVKYHINISHNPLIYFVKRELRIIEGLLSLYGIYSIDLNNPKIVWIPETKDEKEKLQIFNFSSGYQKNDDEKIPHTPFDIIARSIIGANKGFEYEFALSFFRKGRIDIDEERYIEAIYDFYFLLESLFGNGKFKKRQVSTEFKNSIALQQAIRTTLDDPGILLSKHRNLSKKFSDKYQGKSTDDVIDVLIDLRGYLHHHSSKRKGIWDPENQHKYEVDARFIQAICFHIVFELAGKCVFDSEVTQEYKKTFLENSME